jgi:hypothetical protein
MFREKKNALCSDCLTNNMIFIVRDEPIGDVLEALKTAFAWVLLIPKFRKTGLSADLPHRRC